MNDQGLATSGSERPTIWIVIAAILGIAAIGLGIWGYSQKSDLDEANDKAAEQQKQLTAAQGADAAAAARAGQLGKKLKAEDVKVEDLKKEAARVKSELDQARQAEASATSAEDKTAAQLRVATARRSAATACANAALAALNDLLSGSAPKDGAKAAAAKLEASQDACNAVVG